MNANELREQIMFGLENLERIHNTILTFVEKEVDEDIKTSALVYECMGYYNAIEHLIVRFLKHNDKDVPSGPFSHRDTLNAFKGLIDEKCVNLDGQILSVIENLMAFRHVATKIYGFLIRWDKLQFIIQDIQNYHRPIKNLLLSLIDDGRE
ncbi:ribonuclease toxin HepT-like protein [Roseiflexus sp.]